MSNVLKVIDNSMEKEFHLVIRSDDLNEIYRVSKMIIEEHDNDVMIIKNQRYELFTYPVFDDGENAHFRR